MRRDTCPVCERSFIVERTGDPAEFYCSDDCAAAAENLAQCTRCGNLIPFAESIPDLDVDRKPITLCRRCHFRHREDQISIATARRKGIIQ